LTLLSVNLEQAIESFEPDFLLYNAGTDCMEGDPLGRMHLSNDAIQKRDAIVFKICLSHSIPLTMVLSGGYQKSNAPCIADSIENLNKELDILNIAKTNLFKDTAVH